MRQVELPLALQTHRVVSVDALRGIGEDGNTTVGTAVVIEPVALAGYREVVARDAEDKVERHFVILPFAARWIAGEPKLNEELSEWSWVDPADVASMPTTPGLAEIVAKAVEQLRAARY